MIAALIFILTLIPFLPALRAGFVWDDAANLFDNRAYRHFDWKHLKWMFTTTYMGPYQPLSWASLGLDFHLWGMHAWGFHLTNMLLHAANAVLFYFISREFLKRALPDASEREVALGAAVSALFFSLHPLRVESVAWVTERRDVLAGFFGLWATLCWLKGRRLRAILPLYTACLLSKASGVALPAAWLILDYYPLRRLNSFSELKKSFVDKMPFFILAGGAAAFAIAGQAGAGNLRGLSELGVSARVAEALIGLGFYAQKTLWPSMLSPLYRVPDALSVFSARVWISLLAIGACAYAIRLARVDRRAQAALWGYYVLSVLPVSGLLQNGPQLAADRYSYLSCLGWALLAGAAAARARGRLALGGVAVLLVVLGALSFRQTRFWYDDDALWSRALSVDPGSIPARLNYGLALAGKRRMFEALSIYEETEGLAPNNAMVWNHHGYVLLELKRYDEAEVVLRRAVSLDENLGSAWTYLGAASLRQGKFEQAVRELSRAAELSPESELAQDNLEEAQRAVEDAKKAQKKP